MSKFPICILTAGEGTRLLPLTQIINKSLVPINSRPAISHILDLIPKDYPLVIALGHKGEIVQDFLNTFYSDREISYIEVSDYNGKKSGPAVSLLSCQEKLQSPFYYVACDTLWDKKLDELPTDINWVGASSKYDDQKEIYCNIKAKDDNVIEFFNKVDPKVETTAFIGLSFVKDFQVFWKDLDSAVNLEQYDVYHGYKTMVENSQLKTQDLSWNDVGNFENIEKFTSNKYNFSKPNEFIWFDQNKVIKTFRNIETLKAKYNRGCELKSFIPKGLNSSKHFLSYDLEPGETFYNSYSNEAFEKLLTYLQKDFWEKIEISNEEELKEKESFYIDKTRSRISLFKEKYPNWSPRLVNKKKYFSFEDKLLKEVRSQMMANSFCGRFHGDLQFDNIIFQKDFTLIDWRESFGNQSKWGDIYYDFAKLYGGLIINYKLIKENEFKYFESDKEINFGINKDIWQDEAIVIFEKFLKDNGYNISYIRLLCSLIFINMSPLHHYPFDKLLYSLSFELFSEL